MKRVAIVGCGPSAVNYMPMADAYGDRSKRYNEVWCINSMGSVLACDRIFHMDDLKVQELRAKADPEGKIGPMLEFFKRTKLPVITSRAYPDYPTSQAFALDDVVSKFGVFHFTSTPAYAVAQAVFEEFDEMSLYGMDYTWDNCNLAEEGRACIEFWLGFAIARGCIPTIAAGSTLMSTNHPVQRRLYGYDSQDLLQIAAKDGRIQFAWQDKEVLPTAEEMEARYDKTKLLDGVAPAA
jgi:hypothetical protein